MNISTHLDSTDSRASFDQIMAQHNLVSRHNEILAVLQSVPQIAFVINSARQVIYGNVPLLNQLGLSKIEEALGSRPGELMQCVHVNESGSCGDATGCRYCGAVLAILESQTTQQRVTREARVTVCQAGMAMPLDLSVTATPLPLGDNIFTLVFISDISAQKRRDYLEQIFFHDLMNSISGLKMMTDLLSLEKIPSHLQGGINDIHSHIKLITDDVSGHQLLLRAEQGSMALEVTSFPVDLLVKDAIHSNGALSSMNSIAVEYDEAPFPFCVSTDQRLARRVLVNALRNAIEASYPGERVRIQTEKTQQGCILSVHNQREIPEDVQHQIFQRSFSTKAAERGLGTYSMRLLHENYLGGKISFTTSPENGTTFFIYLPNR